MDELERILNALLSDRHQATDDPIEPGVYVLFLNNRESLKRLAVAEEGVLYVGMTADKAGERNHFVLPHSGFSSPRRSLGAVLKDQLSLCACRRGPGASDSNWQNYRFTDMGEDALTKWMREHLSMSHVRLPGGEAEIEKIEKQIIARLKPPLNLTGWHNPQGRELRELRKLCREEAKAKLWDSD